MASFSRDLLAFCQQINGTYFDEAVFMHVPCSALCGDINDNCERHCPDNYRCLVGALPHTTKSSVHLAAEPSLEHHYKFALTNEFVITALICSIIVLVAIFLAGWYCSSRRSRREPGHVPSRQRLNPVPLDQGYVDTAVVTRTETHRATTTATFQTRRGGRNKTNRHSPMVVHDNNCTSAFQYKDLTTEICRNCSDICFDFISCGQLCPVYFSAIQNSSFIPATTSFIFNESSSPGDPGSSDDQMSTVALVVVSTLLMLAQVVLVGLLAKFLCRPVRPRKNLTRNKTVANSDIELAVLVEKDARPNEDSGSKLRVKADTSVESGGGAIDKRLIPVSRHSYHRPYEETMVSADVHILTSGSSFTLRKDGRDVVTESGSSHDHDPPRRNSQREESAIVSFPSVERGAQYTKKSSPFSSLALVYTDVAADGEESTEEDAPLVTELGISLRPNRTKTPSPEQTVPKLIYEDDPLAYDRADGGSRTPSVTTHGSISNPPLISLREKPPDKLPPLQSRQLQRQQNLPAFPVPQPVSEGAHLSDDGCPTSDLGAAAPKRKARTTRERVENGRIIAGLPYVASIVDDESLAVFVHLSQISISRAREEIMEKTGLEAYEFNLLPWDGDDGFVSFSAQNLLQPQPGQKSCKHPGLRGYVIVDGGKGGVVSFILGVLVTVDGVTHITAPAHAFQTSLSSGNTKVFNVYSSPLCSPEYRIGECHIRSILPGCGGPKRLSYFVDVALVRVRKSKVKWIARLSTNGHACRYKFEASEQYIGKRVQLMLTDKQVDLTLGVGYGSSGKLITLKPESSDSRVLLKERALSGALVVTVAEPGAKEVKALTIVCGVTWLAGRLYLVACPLLESFKKLERLYNCKIEEWDGTALHKHSKLRKVAGDIQHGYAN